jgi:TldD protein
VTIATTVASVGISTTEAERVLRTALARGGDWAELFWERHHALSLLFDDGRLEEATSGVEQGAGIRVTHGQISVYANGNVASYEDLLDLAGRAAAAVSSNEALESELRPPARADLTARSPVAIDPRDVPVERKTALLELANATARSHDPRIEQVTAAYRESVQEIFIANSDGTFAADRRVRLVCAVNAVARSEGLQQTGYESLGGTVGFEMMTPEAAAEVARTAARRAILNLEAEPAPAGTFMVVLSSEAGGTLIHETVGHGLEADLNDRGLSVYAGKIGQRVASELITVIDDGSLPGKRGTSTIDDEGTPTQRNVLIEGGVLRGYMTDRKHARKMGLPLSGNGRRESFRHLPICRMTNTLIAPGDGDPDEILRSVKEGIFVRKMGGGQVDVVSGNFAFEITEGYRIEQGRLAGAIRGATLTGQGPTVMTQIDMVARDLGFSIGTCGKDGQGAPVADAQPTLRIPAIVIGGITEESRTKAPRT